MAEATTIDDTLLAQADHRQRHWALDEPGAIAIGSDAHKRLFCRMLVETHHPYKPAVIQWPVLDADARHRIVSLPIWDIAVQTEGRAGLRVQTYGETIADAELRDAVILDASEEKRHKEVLANLVAAYGIVLEPEPVYVKPRDPEWAFLRTGYSECMDSLFSFGLFALAERSGFFPKELVDTFEPVIQEEARHITFFVNWLAWHRANLAWWRRPWFDLKRAGVLVTIAADRLGTAFSVGGKAGGAKKDENFTATSHKAMGIEVSARGLFELCLSENDRRLAGYDPRLLRPTLMPALLRLVLRVMKR